MKSGKLIRGLTLLLVFLSGASRDSNAQPVAGSVDLLESIDPQRDGVAGTWMRQESSITSVGGNQPMLVLPDAPPAQYRWTVVLERLSGSGSMNLVLAVGDQQTMLVLEGFDKQCSGLNLVSGLSADRNATTTIGPIFRSGTPTTIVCTVRPTDITVQCNDKTIIHWVGSSSQLSLDRRFWSAVPANRLAVSAFGTDVRVRISKMTLERLGKEVDATARLVPDGSNRAGPTSPPMVVAGGTSGAGSQGTALRPVESAKESASPGTAPHPAEPGTPVNSGLTEVAIDRTQSVALVEHPLGTGTGFVVGSNLLVTNAHVVECAFVEEMRVNFPADGDTQHRPTRIVYKNAVCDLCLLEIETDKPAIPIAPQHSLSPGEPVVLIGNPSINEDVMLRNAVTSGTMGALMRISSYDFFQINAEVNPGSSGGPVLNADGELIAVVALKATKEGAGEIREAVSKLDASFATQFGQTGQRGGMAFGIPVVAVQRALRDVGGQRDGQVVQLNGRHRAETLFQRMTMLGALHLLELQAKVPDAVRRQAIQVRRGGQRGRSLNGTGSDSQVELMPEAVAERLEQILQGDESRTLMRVCWADLDVQLAKLHSTPSADRQTVKQLEELLASVKQSKEKAQRPPRDYRTFSRTVRELSDQMKHLIEDLSTRLHAEEPAF